MVTEYNKDMTMVFIGFDGYSDMWDDCINLFKKFWPDCPYKTIFVNNEKDVFWDKIEVLHAGKNAEWSKKVQLAISKIETPYVCLLLEDFLVGKTIETDTIRKTLNFIKKENLDISSNGQYFSFKITERQVFVDYEIYTVKIKNNTMADMYFNDTVESNLYVKNSKNAEFSINSSEYIDANYYVPSNSEKNVNLKFNVKYQSDNEIVGMYFENMIIAVYLFIVEHKNIKKMSIWKKILYTFTWPTFDIIGRYATYAALFMHVEWKPIPHESKVTIDDLNK